MSVKIILRGNKENKQGQHPIAVQIVKDRKASIIHIGQWVKPDEWDAINNQVKKSHPNHARINNLIRKKLAEASDKELELTTEKEHVSAKAIRNKIKPTTGETFLPQAELYLATLERAGKFNQTSANKPRIKHFKEFVGGDIAFSDITVNLLERYKAWLKGTRKVSDRTVMNHLVVIRSVFSQAINDEIVDPKFYPFGKGKIKIKFPDSAKIGLTREEITALEEVDLPERQDEARDIFLLSLYAAGMRISDAMRLNWNDIQDGRLHYVMGKNNKGGSLKLTDKANAILEKYRGKETNNNLVFSPLQTLPDLDDSNAIQKRIKSHVHDMNEQLRKAAKAAGIKKDVTFHISRHSFAQLAGDKIDIRTLQELYRHTSIATTIGYQSNFTHKKMDDAIDNVLG